MLELARQLGSALGMGSSRGLVSIVMYIQVGEKTMWVRFLMYRADCHLYHQCRYCNDELFDPGNGTVATVLNSYNTVE